MKELAWLAEARKHIGLKEIPGAKHNPIIQAWLKGLVAWWKDDETPWCGVFVAHCLKAGGRDLPKNWFRAKEYETYGSPLEQPAYGCVATFTRQGGGHVGFVVGETEKGDLLIYSGNQSNGVNIAAFPKLRATSYHWPSKGGQLLPPDSSRYTLPKGIAAASKSEA
ncbi:TIGR02594 family protein [Neisseria cinerea]|uniref:TIGR02594 family protein n=1 Tax=Neisseria cinerea TaxID=483 RepID=UPI0028D80F90|nr:TIGR02594 family protein [Neisseria cinerea]